MTAEDPAARADRYVKTLCSVKPNRRTGSSGNRAATDFVVEALRPHGCAVEATPFACLDYLRDDHFPVHDGESFEVSVSPYSPGCDVLAELVVASTTEDLRDADCEGKILLMKGSLCTEQLMPRNFVFYNPDRHKALLALLESKQPAAIVAATRMNPDQVGALDPSPLIVDGDFDIPSVCCGESVGEALARLEGEALHLKIAAQRIPSTAANVIARWNEAAPHKIVVTAHIDAYEDSPGALDNASGTVVLLLLAELLSGYPGKQAIEIVALNGEDHYSAGGQMQYLERYRDEFHRIRLAVNIDDVGFKHGGTAYSFYECAPELRNRVETVFRGFDGLVSGDPWFQGDHRLFVQSGVPSVAFTAERGAELMRTVTHTPRDTPDLVEGGKLVEVARAMNGLIRAIDAAVAQAGWA